MSALENFRTNLRAVLDREGISQYQLSNLAKVSRDHINKILRGSVQPSVEYCEKLAESVKIPLPIMFLEPEPFQRILESDIDKSVLRDGALLAMELLPTKPTPPGKGKRSVKMSENVRMRNWIRQIAAMK